MLYYEVINNKQTKDDFFFFFLRSPAISLGLTTFGWDLRCDRFFNPTIKVVTFRLHGWCVLGVFVAGIHPSRTWTSGSFESVRWNACVHRLDLGLYSHPKEFWGNGVWTHVNSKGKIPSTGKCPQRSIEPATLWQRAQALPTELFRPPKDEVKTLHVLWPVQDKTGLQKHGWRTNGKISRWTMWIWM